MRQQGGNSAYTVARHAVLVNVSLRAATQGGVASRRPRLLSRILATTAVIGLAFAPAATSAANLTTPTPTSGGGANTTAAAAYTGYNPSDHNAVGQGGCNFQYTDKLNSLAESSALDNEVGQAANAASWGVATAQLLSSGGEFTDAAAGLGTAAGGLTDAATGLGIASGGKYAGSAGLSEAAAGVVVPLDAGAAAPGLTDAGAGMDATGGGLDDTAAGLGVASGGLTDTSTALGSLSGTSALAYAGLTAQTAGVATGVSGAVIQQQQTDLAKYVSYLPNCDTIFNGTITANANVVGAQGIAADNGAINLGNPDGTTYQPGITIGGGAVSGAGSSG